MAKQNGGKCSSDVPKCATFLLPSTPIPAEGVTRRSASRIGSPRDRSRNVPRAAFTARAEWHR